MPNRDRVVRLAPVALLAALLAGVWLHGFIGADDGSAGSAAAQSAETPLSEDAARFFGTVERLRLDLTGTRAESAAWTHLLAEQQLLAECMAGTGFTYRVPELEPLVQGHYYEPSWWRAPSTRGVRPGFGYGEVPPDAPAAYTPDPSSVAELDAYQAALEGCGASVDFDPGQAEELRQASNALLGDLHERFRDQVERPGFAVTRSRYAQCMAGDGYPVEDPGGLYDLVEQRAGKTGIYDTDPRDAAYPAALARARDVGAQAAAADVRCRRPLADEIAGQLGPILTAWLAEHRVEVDRVAMALRGSSLAVVPRGSSARDPLGGGPPG